MTAEEKEKAKEVLDKLLDMIKDTEEKPKADNRLKTWIDELPSFQPIRPKGEWINGVCSNCGRVPSFKYERYGGNCCTIIDYSNFCPDCGAKMVEPQESEDKE